MFRYINIQIFIPVDKLILKMFYDDSICICLKFWFEINGVLREQTHIHILGLRLPNIYTVMIRYSAFSLHAMLRPKTEHTERFLGNDLAGECDPDCDADQP